MGQGIKLTEIYVRHVHCSGRKVASRPVLAVYVLAVGVLGGGSGFILMALGIPIYVTFPASATAQWLCLRAVGRFAVRSIDRHVLKLERQVVAIDLEDARFTVDSGELLAATAVELAAIVDCATGYARLLYVAADPPALHGTTYRVDPSPRLETYDPTRR
ncbi:hypothetical protein [Actinomadura geliboluensis]|uniref:Uncharacterized protein n=1 Tax=Actinomadura geliboluensis TaxID=882440 RepID=A0A5S4HJY9_9ACTN|nr:hypothetical protein [Actinomadura geliboluensis]TMR40550.1 hypothetical protein ETD96_10205 [Actinomadura geliboluensis]